MDGVCAECRDYMAEGHGETEALGCLLFHRSRTPGSPCHCRCVSRLSRREAVTLAASLGHIHCVNTLTRAGADLNKEEEAEADVTRAAGIGADVNWAEEAEVGVNRAEETETDVSRAEGTESDVNMVGEAGSVANESRDLDSLSQTGADVNKTEKSAANVNKVKESRSCTRELRRTETGAGVNEPEQLVTVNQTPIDLNKYDSPENCECRLIDSNEGWNRSTHSGANVNKLIDTVVNTPVQVDGDVNRLKYTGDDVNESSQAATREKYSVNRNTNHALTVVKEPITDEHAETQDNLNIRKPIEAGGDGKGEIIYVRCKDDGASVNRDDNLVHSALVSAVEHNQCDCTEMLVEAGADVNARKSLVLVEAARTGHDRCLEILLNKATMKVEIDACDSNKPSPLMWAVGKGHLTCAELLVKSGANVNQTFIEAVKSRDYDLAERLFDLGAGEKLRTAFGKKFFTYLFRKACHKCLESLLKKERTDIREAFRTLLMCSTETKTLKCVEPLVEAGADVNTRLDKGYTALMLAAKQGNQKCVQYLISKGANMNMVDQEQFETPLLKASFNMHYGCARLLLLAGAPVNMGSSKNDAPFRTTVNKTMVLLLHAAGEILIIDDSIVRKFAGHIYCESNKVRLKHQCRRAIRNHMLEVDLYRNQILRVQRLGLPKPLVSYMLFNQPILDE